MLYNKKMELSDVCNVNNTYCGESQVSVELEKPKRILHFSDGVCEDFSEDDEDINKSSVDGRNNEIIEANSTWFPWLLHKTVKAGSTILAGCDYAGGALASFLGITTPKYQYEIDEFKKAEQENTELEKEKQDSASWQESRKLNTTDAITKELDKRDERF